LEVTAAKLDASQNKLLSDKIEALFNSLHDLLIVFNSHGRILMTNPFVQEKLGYPFELMLIKSIHDLRPQELQLKSQQILRRIVSGKTNNFDLPFTTMSGHVIEVEGRIGETFWNSEKIFFGLFRDVTEKRKAEKIAIHTANRDKLLAKISTRLINFDGDGDIVHAAHEMIAEVGQFFSSQRAFLFTIDGHCKDSVSCEWFAPGIDGVIKELDLLPSLDLSQWISKVATIGFMVVPSVDTFSSVSQFEKGLVGIMGTQSVVVVPISCGSQACGFVGLADSGFISQISRQEVDFLRTTGEIIVHTIADQRRRATLEINEQRLSYSMAAAKHAVWDLDWEAKEYTISQMHLDIIGVESDIWPSDIALNQWLNRVHPSDLPKVNQSLYECANGISEGYACEYRIRHEDGDWVWVFSSGVLVKKDVEDRKKRIVGSLQDITEQKQSNLSLHAKLELAIRETTSFHGIVGKSKAMQQVFETILQAATSDTNVVITGESGTGKELTARAVHTLSSRNDKPFVIVNCGAIPDTILESEFFGYKKGAFSGAIADKPGFLDTAHQGTLFLDELGELPIAMQVKLLRALEGGGYIPVGDTEEKFSDFRIVAATNRDLKAMVDAGKMREDFFYRIHIIPIQLPPLRERKDDIPLLVYHFMNEIGDSDGKHQSFPGEILDAMVDYDWPGNVRELQNVINRYLTLGEIDFNISNVGAPIDTKAENLPFKTAISRIRAQTDRRRADKKRW
jgi:PAS domain S-box-containing protein